MFLSNKSMNEKRIVERRKHIANIVKKNMWANNVRATVRGQNAGSVLMLGKYKVWCTEDQMEDRPKGYDFLALVRDYKDFCTVRLFNKKGKQLKAAFYHAGRLKQNLPV